MINKKLLTLTLASLGMAFVNFDAAAGTVFNNASYSADINFQDALSSTTMSIAFDGSNYWSASGGSSDGVRYAQYGANGNAIATFSPGIDFRSVFTDSNNDVYARGFASNTIYKQTSPGVFTSYLSLIGGVLDAQSSVVMNSNGDFVAMQGGNVSIWNAAGAFNSSFSLNGFSGSYPDDRGIAATGNYLFTYQNQSVSAWDYNGNLLDQAALLNAGNNFSSYFSLSYTNNHLFVVDNEGQSWKGYDIGLSEQIPVPEPANFVLLFVGLAGFQAFNKKRKNLRSYNFAAC